MLRWLGVLVRLLVGGVWIFAGALKLPDPESSVTAVRAYQLLPIGSTTFIGHLLPILEIAVGVLLIVGLFVRPVALLSGVMLLAFIIGISSVWARGIEINCGCFGDGGANPNASSAYPWEIARDVGLLLASAYVVWRPRSPYAVDTLLRAPEQTEHDHTSED